MHIPASALEGPVKYTTDIQKIEDLLVGRTALEQDLALDVSKEFTKSDLFSRINVAVWAACSFLEGLKTEPALVTTIKNCEKDNDFLFHSNPKNLAGVLSDFDKGLRLSPEYCADLIRFYGEVIEKCASFSIYWRKQRAKQIVWRYGGGGETFKASRDDNYVAKADKGMVWRRSATTYKDPTVKDAKAEPVMLTQWRQGEGGKDPLWKKSVVPAPDEPGGRIRTKDKKVLGEVFKKGANPYYDIIPGNLFQDEKLKKLHIGKKFGGVMNWKIEDTSTIGRIDRTFGLPYGADISGTTSDNLYFLTGWADASKGDPLVMMLPLAAIIGEYHHSLLEVAAAMSLRRVISYSIGFYSTLLPPLPQGVSANPQRGDIAALLDKFEKDPRNQHLLLHYNKNNEIAGCFIAEGADLDGFRKLGTVDIHLWPKFNSLPAYPPEDKIIGLLAEVGLANAAFAARGGALRGANAQADMERQRLEKKLGFAA
jgi:hypothetical protein